jgi:hypothetical protein
MEVELVEEEKKEEEKEEKVEKKEVDDKGSPKIKKPSRLGKLKQLGKKN